MGEQLSCKIQPSSNSCQRKRIVIISLSAFDLQYLVCEVKYVVLCVIYCTYCAYISESKLFNRPQVIHPSRQQLLCYAEIWPSWVLTARQQSTSCSKKRAKRRWSKLSALLPDVTHHSLFTFKAKLNMNITAIFNPSTLLLFLSVHSVNKIFPFASLNFVPEPPKQQ